MWGVRFLSVWSRRALPGSAWVSCGYSVRLPGESAVGVNACLSLRLAIMCLLTPCCTEGSGGSLFGPICAKNQRAHITLKHFG